MPGVPAFYLHLGPDQCFGGGGVYHVDSPQLTRIRRRIVDAPREWAAVRERVEIHGEQLKRAPAGFPPAHEHVEDLKRKNLYTLTEFSRSRRRRAPISWRGSLTRAGEPHRSSSSKRRRWDSDGEGEGLGQCLARPTPRGGFLPVN